MSQWLAVATVRRRSGRSGQRTVSVRTIGGTGHGFSHAVETSGVQRVLYIAGQVGSNAEGHTPVAFEAQCHRVWDRIEALLREAGMTLNDLARTTVYLTSAADVGAFREVRRQRLGDIAPASTLVIVSALVRPEFRVEVEAIASRGD